MTARRRTRLSRPLTRAAAVAAAMALSSSVITGCGTLAGASELSKDTVTVMTWAPQGTRATNMAGMPAMAQAYARWVNHHGGINGHPLRVLTCNDHNDTVGAGRCARRAINQDVVAVVGSYSQYGQSFMPQLEAAGIPYIGGYGITSEEFNSPLSYPVNGGMATLLAGNGRQLARSCDRVSLVRPDTLSGDQMPPLLDTGLRAAGRRPAADVRAPEDATEYTEEARLALAKAGADPLLYAPTAAAPGRACVTAVLGDRTDTFFDSFRRSQETNARVHIASVLGSVQQSLVIRTGGASSPLNGALVTGWYPVPSDPRWEPMRTVVREQAFGDNRIDTADPGVQTTWIAYTVLRAAIESLGDQDVTAKSLRRALDGRIGDGGVHTGGLTPTLSWRYEDLLAVRDFTRITNAMVTYQEVRGGQLVSARRGFVDLAQTLENRPVEG